jgi:lipopolysaccharide export LptBFGC system permease protein LptF
MQRLLRLLVGPLVGFGVSAFVTLVGLRFFPRDLVAPVAVGAGLAAVTYFSPTSRRRRSLAFSLALGVLIAVFFAITIRFLGNASA